MVVIVIGIGIIVILVLILCLQTFKLFPINRERTCDLRCSKVIKTNKDIDSITGNISYEKDEIDNRYRSFNSNNDCEYFRKVLFVKQKDKKYCCNCLYFYETDFGASDQIL